MVGVKMPGDKTCCSSGFNADPITLLLALFADDLINFANQMSELASMLTDVANVLAEVNLKINWDKTKIFTTRKEYEE